MQMLGPSITAATIPFAFGYSLFASLRSKPPASRSWSYAALAICAIEVIAAACVIIASIIQIVRGQ
jgi:hypothetical protein